jgi:hypothetical protein
MKTAFSLAVLAVLLVAPGRCFALWGVVSVSKEGSKKLGMEVRSAVAGNNQVRVELEFKTEGKFVEFSPEGKFKARSGVEMRIGEGDNPRLFGSLSSPHYFGSCLTPQRLVRAADQRESCPRYPAVPRSRAGATAATS